jgi:hypothetical protein
MPLTLNMVSLVARADAIAFMELRPHNELICLSSFSRKPLTIYVPDEWVMPDGIA